jgi:hypothetical protein
VINQKKGEKVEKMVPANKNGDKTERKGVKAQREWYHQERSAINQKNGCESTERMVSKLKKYRETSKYEK